MGAWDWGLGASDLFTGGDGAEKDGAEGEVTCDRGGGGGGGAAAGDDCPAARIAACIARLAPDPFVVAGADVGGGGGGN